ncbi:MAG: family 43 glycosylhydrolase [Lachnospiraceae bacterium]|nr:family 43 glycosylhydrolase [Lachnospiraceae bacterium]
MKNKRILTLLLSLVVLIMSTVSVFAADNEKSVDGIKVKVSLDKESYEPGETVTMSVSIKNDNDYDVTNVSIKYPGLPTDVEFDKKTMESKIPKLKAGEFHKFEVKGVANGTPTATESEGGFFGKIKDVFLETETIVDEAAGTTTTVTKLSSTGIIIIVALVAVILVLVAVVIIIVKKKGRNAEALLLVVALAAGSVAGVAPVNTVNAEVSEETMVSNSDFKRVSVHDPSIVKDPKTGTYYVFGSHLAWAKSTDLVNWQNFTTNINTQSGTLFGDVWNNYCSVGVGGNLNGNMWAPDVVWNDVMNKWCMYMSINNGNWQSAIVLLTADNIEGPYTYVDEVVFSGFFDNGDKSNAKLNEKRVNYTDVYKVLGEGADLSRYSKTGQSLINCIDPCVTIDDNGDHWMTYGSWSAGIYQLKIDKTTGLRDYNMKYETKINESDAYLGYKIAGGHYNSGEGPYIFKAGDYYYLFISLGNLETSGGYNMRVYRSESINGPYVDENGKSAIFKAWFPEIGFQQMATTSKYNTKIGVKLFGSYRMYGISQVQAAQGHNSAFVDDDGKIYLIYHTRFAGNSEGHQLRVHQMFINENDWLIAAPYEYGKESLSTTGYSKEDICGTYEFIMHKPALVYNYNNGKQVGVAGGSAVSNNIIVSQEFNVGATVNKVKIRVDFTKTGTETIKLNENGNITGDYTGTWESKDNINVTLKIDNVEYKGVFLKQQNELSTRDITMTFTALGSNVTIWGVKELEN